MEEITSRHKKETGIYWIAAIAGISLVIIIHECGHFLFAHLFNVPVTTFSLGFGPAIIQIPYGSILYQIAMIPFGGYVEMDPQALAARPYAQKMIIMLAGIAFNIIFCFIILTYYKLRGKGPIRPLMKQILPQPDNKSIIIGPIGIIQMIGKSLTISYQLFWSMLAMISLNIGLFNLIPLPFFDGGKALIFTIEALAGKTIPEYFLWPITIIFLCLFLLFIFIISANDLKNIPYSGNNQK
jgi:membrane-associated protease RseP (regulator of RpoE activity)